MPAGVIVDRGVQSSDENALFHPTAKPIVVGGDYGEVSFANVVVLVASVLHDRRFILTWCTEGG